MTTSVAIYGADAGDFADGKLLWNALNALKPAKKAPPELVDLSEVSFLHPYAAATIAALGILAGNTATLVVPKTQLARDFVFRSGLHRYFRVSEATALSGSPRSIEVRRLVKPDSNFADELTQAWEDEFSGMPPGLRPRLADHLDEMIRNALAHSRSSIGCIVAAQLYPSKREVEVVVLDVGQTVRVHLTNNPEHSEIRTDAEAILRATGEGVTGTLPGTLNILGEPNSGIGLFELRRYCESGQGRLVIASGDALIVFSEEGEPIKRHFAGGFPGCLVNMIFKA